MRKDLKAEINIRSLNKMNKKEVKSLVAWLRLKARALESQVEKGQPWIVTRSSFAGLFRYGLFK